MLRYQTKIGLLLLAAIYFLVLKYFVLINPPDLFQVEAVHAVKQAEFIYDNATEPSLINQADWQKQDLPDDWYHTQKKRNVVWYRATFSPESNQREKHHDYQEQLWAIYLPVVSHNASVYINNTLVGFSGDRSRNDLNNQPATARHHNEPQYFTFPSSIITPKDNLIMVRVEASFYEQGLFDAFYIAPASKLTEFYNKKYFYRVTLVEWGNVGLIILLLIIFPVWLIRRRDRKFGILSLVLVFWISHNLNLVVHDIPTSAFFWEAMTMATLGWTVVSLIIFNCYYLNARSPVIEKLLLLYAFSGFGLFLLPDIKSILHIGYLYWDGCLVLIGIYGIYQISKAFWLRNEKNSYPILLVGITIIVFGLHDILLVNHLIDRRDGLIIQFTLFPAIIVYSNILFNEFVQSMNHADELTRTLENRVREKQKAIENQFNELRKMERNNVLSEERERLMRDMHDGIGGNLVAILSMLKTDTTEPDDKKLLIKIQKKIQQSLTDLRFVIDSLDPLLSDLPTLLGMMRLRILDQLESAGIELLWTVTELPEFKHNSPQRSLHIMRIIQEAINNTIKHAGASHITIATGTIDRNADKIYIDIIDDGRGWDTKEATLTREKRGIKNMQYRAEQIDADIEINSTINAGTRIRLSLTLDT